MNEPIIRVFPRRNSYTPCDRYAFFGSPPEQRFIPEHSAIHVSCVFTWDKDYCARLADEWTAVTSKPVQLGGPAFGTFADGFTRGLYIKKNVIFTTRGCNYHCPWCVVPNIEGRLHELPKLNQGNWIQDNNFLQASRMHKNKVFDMLRTQRAICFKGGLECDLIDDHFCDSLQSLYYTRKNGDKVSRVKELWIACDTDGALLSLKKACAKLAKAGFKRDKIYCYALIGDDMDKNEARLREIYNAGALPRAQLYRDFSDTKTEYDTDWNAFERMWTRPAALKAHMERGTDWRDFHT